MRINFNNKIVAVTLILFVLLVLTGSNLTFAQEKEYKMAAVFPGSIQDADWNTIGYKALQNVNEQLGIEVAYSEQVAVSDAPRVVREYISLGYNILWIHGTQFNNGIFDLAENYPDVTFIVEQDTPLPEDFNNVIQIKRNYYVGHYVLGALASEITETGKIGFVGGLKISWTIGVVNAIQQAVVNEFSVHRPQHEQEEVLVVTR